MSHLRAFRRVIQRRRSLIAVIAVVVATATVTPAVAADAGPSVSIRQYGDIVYATGSGYPASSSLLMKATFNDLSGSGSGKTTSRGTFTQGFRLPSGMTGVLTVTGTAGGKSATATKGIGVTTATTAAPATTTSTAVKAVTTTAAPTTTTAKPATTTSTTAAPQPPTSSATPQGPSGSWRMVFGDEFDGTSIDRAKFPECHWATRPGCVGQNSNELQAYRPGNLTVSGGSAHLTAKRESVFVPELNTTLPYTAGSIATGSWDGKPSTFKFKYGYVESRIKVAPGKGLWSSLWMEQANHVWPPEIDIVEAPNFESGTVYNNVHYGTPENRGQQNQAVKGSDWSAGYHVFGLEWTANSLKWYVDGKLVRTFSDAAKIPQNEMYIIANLSVGGWAGTPPSSTPFPATMSIDYIRIWQR